ncbi:MAG TPA: mersacidin/lichenicidin family type 2 lantibiotic [Ktedonosporobacter sp.]|nr:mersacidin/lichenicidin family type 2 lantibiotic [Ktedonosporobacter sp.]
MMVDVVRAWTDEAYRRSLAPALLAQFPTNPVGESVSSDTALLLGNNPLDPQVSQVSYCLSVGPCCPTYQGVCTILP